jgi:hypothetical protein
MLCSYLFYSMVLHNSLDLVEVRGERVLLCKRHSGGHPGAAKVPPTGPLHRHRHPSRRWRSGFLHPQRTTVLHINNIMQIFICEVFSPISLNSIVNVNKFPDVI